MPEDDEHAPTADAASGNVESATADAENAAEPDDAPIAFPVKRRRRGGVIGNALMGLEAALYGPRDNEIVMVADADGMPEPDFTVDLTPDPRDSTVRMRRHWWKPRH